MKAVPLRLGGPYWPPHESPLFWMKKLKNDTEPLKGCLALKIYLHLNDISTDIDICLHYDANGNGIYDGAEKDPEVAYSGKGTGEDEEIKMLNPPDGYYFLIVNLYAGPSQTTFDLDITMVSGKGFVVSKVTPPGPLPPNTKATVELSWDLPSRTPDGLMMGVLYLGPQKAPMCLGIPISLLLERVKPVIKITGVGDGAGRGAP